MRPIPQLLKSEILSDKFYTRCCLCNSTQVEWHNNLIFAGRQVNEKWCIIPLCKTCHAIADRKDIKSQLNWIMLNRGSNFELQSVSKAIKYLTLKETLNKQYGIYRIPRELL